MLKQRIITAVILIPIVLGSIFWLPPLYFGLLIGMVVLLGAWEWLTISGVSNQLGKLSFLALLALSWWLLNFGVDVSYLIVCMAVLWAMAIIAIINYPKSAVVWRITGLNLGLAFLVLLTAWLSICFIKTSVGGQWYLLLLLFAIWGADVGAYFFGKAYGNKKLAPHVSPGKSWAGVYGGLFSAGIITLIWSFAMGLSTVTMLYWLLAMSLVIIISIIGDLTESMLKRTYGVKDSGTILPGHGGVLDRIDSLLSASPVFVTALLLVSTNG